MKNIFYDLIVCWKSWENKKPYESSSEGMRESRAVLMEIFKSLSALPHKQMLLSIGVMQRVSVILLNNSLLLW